MPTPAAPAPAKTMRWSAGRPRVMRIAESMPASATAEVPWMSSLKLGMRLR